MDVKIFSVALSGNVENELKKLETQIGNYVRNKEIISICQSIKQEQEGQHGQEPRIIITVMTK